MTFSKTIIMNIAKRFILLLLVAVSTPIWGGNLYIQYDPSCMDRLEYTTSNATQSGSYIVYQLEVNENETLIMEVGVESQRYQTYLPSQTINCSNAIFSKKMADDINSKIDQAFIVYSKGRNQYSISPVSFAAYFRHQEEKLVYTSPQYQFELNLKQGIIGENIAINQKRSEVYFDGRLENQCSGAYLFRQFSLYTSTPHMDIVLVPEIGVVEERSGRNSEDALNNIRRLNKVNDLYLSDYMDMVCLGLNPANKETESTGSYFKPTIDKDLQVKTGTATVAKQHTVQKGETLFRISKNFNVSVANIRKWNNMGNSNLIRPGDKLWVTPPSAIPAKNTEVIKGTPDNMPAPYDNMAWGNEESGQGSFTGNSWESGESTHIVRPGETVAAIAMKYGYTEARFRAMNSLQPNEMAKIGQTLVTRDCPAESKPLNNMRSEYTYSNYMKEESNYVPPVYESTTLPTDYYYSQRLNDQTNTTNNQSSSNRTYQASVPPFEPYGSNTPSFYDSPETQFVRKGRTTRSSATKIPKLNPTNYNNDSEPAYYDDTIPQGYEMAIPGQAGQSAGYSSSRNRSTHVVKDRENLYSIAKIYGVSAQKLRQLNNLEIGEVILPGQKLFIN